MPKIVDHEQRRRELTEALWRVIAESGPEAVSIRTVAAEAGLSTGALRHYFQTREELLVFAMRLAEERVTERMIAHQSAQDPATTVVDQVAGLAEQLLPLDETRLAEYRAWEAAGMLGERDTDREHRWREQRRLYRRLVAGLARLPADDPSRPHPDADVEEWSEHLHTYVDGLALQLVVTPSVVGPEGVRARLRAFLVRVEAVLARPDA
ncbi:TetR family transcriptional regulator [Nocardiopsis sp. Huas11]|uniref:TetR/AcrR family transcriptional regulator n=1 Tax=Nocardiopsis sp. Huas11 TaxID=2183912 RepID=UPI000EAC3255|nr:TetR family transcriptional regulator C-terminal domain-containing protein [Nocardiopsis sp. Huas11]RKS08747.1 TetR family transcriptional regulator [Nocardiopsis sp. Huas11]